MKNHIHSAAKRRAPGHLWLTAVLGLLGSAFTAWINVLTNIRHPAYMTRLPTDLVLMIDDFPAWMTAAWTLAVWGTIAGSLLLLLRSRLAAPVFAMSFAGVLASGYYLSRVNLPHVLQAGAAIAALLAMGCAVAFLTVYAFRMSRKGVLR